MFDIGFLELVLIAVIALVVIGPKRLPETIRTAGLWVGRAKRALNRAYKEMDRELGLDDIRRQLHNEEVMRSLDEHKKRLEAEILGKARDQSGTTDPNSETGKLAGPAETSAPTKPVTVAEPEKLAEGSTRDAVFTNAENTDEHAGEKKDPPKKDSGNE